MPMSPIDTLADHLGGKRGPKYLPMVMTPAKISGVLGLNPEVANGDWMALQFI
jgi:hypothetical protein